MWKAIISDLDGTLLGDDHLISARTRNTLHAIAKQGIEIIIATGRHHVDTQHIRANLGLDIDLITSNGARVQNAQDEVLFQQAIVPELVPDLIQFGLNHPAVHMNVYQGDDWFVDSVTDELKEYFNEATSPFNYQLINWQHYQPQQVNKVFYVADYEILLPLEKSLLAQYGDRCDIQFSSPRSLEVMAKGINKGQAVAHLLGLKGIALQDAIAFGDGMNDQQMLAMVGHGVLMGNALPRLKEQLPHHPATVTSGQDGVAVYLEQHYAI